MFGNTCNKLFTVSGSGFAIFASGRLVAGQQVGLRRLVQPTLAVQPRCGMCPGAIGGLVAPVSLDAGEQLGKRDLADCAVEGFPSCALADFFRVNRPELVEGLRAESVKRDDSPDRFFLLNSFFLICVAAVLFL